MYGALTSIKKRIAKPLLKELPSEVARQVRKLAEEYNIKSAEVCTVSPEYKFYAGEGDRFVTILGERSKSVEMAASHTGGAYGNSKIGAQWTAPIGSWTIKIHYYTKYWMDIINVVYPELSPKTAQQIV